MLQEQAGPRRQRLVYPLLSVTGVSQRTAGIDQRLALLDTGACQRPRHEGVGAVHGRDFPSRPSAVGLLLGRVDHGIHPADQRLVRFGLPHITDGDGDACVAGARPPGRIAHQSQHIVPVTS
jgi:hypothetical protein